MKGKFRMVCCQKNSTLVSPTVLQPTIVTSLRCMDPEAKLRSGKDAESLLGKDEKLRRGDKDIVGSGSYLGSYKNVTQ